MSTEQDLKTGVTTRKEEEMGTVKSLGSGKTKYEYIYNPSLLEVFDNKHPENDYMVGFDAFEFTSLCPLTLQQDVGTMYINYIPGTKMVESKSLKLYLNSYRMTGSFHEDCVNKIMKDLITVMPDVKYIEVYGRFNPRGGIAIYPFANYAIPEYQEWVTRRQFEMCNKNMKGGTIYR